MCVPVHDPQLLADVNVASVQYPLAAEQSGAQHVLELGVVQFPLMQVYEHAPVYPLEHVPLVSPLATELLTQFNKVLAVQPAYGVQVFVTVVVPSLHDAVQVPFWAQVSGIFVLP